MMPLSRNEKAAAEMVGIMMLIAIFVTVVVVIAVVLFSQPAPDKIPAISMTMSNQSRIIEISHDSGEAISFEDLIVRVDDVEVPASAQACQNCGQDMSLGDSIKIDYTNDPRYATSMPNKIDVIYKKSGQQHQLLTTRYLGTMTPTPTPGTIPTTATPVPTGTASYFRIVSSAGEGGVINPSGTIMVAPGGSQVFTIIPFLGYHPAEVSVDGVPVLPVPLTYSFDHVGKDGTITASFSSDYEPGIVGSYYQDRQWSLLPVTHIHDRIWFADKEGVSAGISSDVNDWPVEYISKDNNFSVSYDGLLKIDAPGTYTFYMWAGDGNSLTIDGISGITALESPSTGVGHAATNYTYTVTLTPGYHPISAKMWDNTGSAVIHLEYSNTSGLPRQVISKYYHSTVPVTVPTVDFTGSPRNGVAPHTVKFTDASLNATSWQWDFGDGSGYVYDQNPTHTYTDPGIYPVSLIAANTIGSAIRTRPNYIAVVSSYTPGLSATYFANATWSDPGRLRTDPRIWFSDRYYAPPTYDFRSDPSDDPTWPSLPGGQTESFSVIWDGYLRVPADTAYSFHLISDDGAYLWIDEDLIIDNGGLHPEKSQYGNVTLTAGYHHIVVKMYENTERALAYLLYSTPSTPEQPVTDLWHVDYSVVPVASFTATPVTGNAPLVVSFADTSGNGPTSWLWDFGDGNTTGNTQQNPVHLYTDEGTYAVTLTASNTGGSSTSGAQTIVVNPALPAITGVSPAAGPTGGGTTVTITGNYFTGATAVKFGGVNAVSYSVISDTEIRATSPARAAGVVDITVTTAAGTSPITSLDRFTYGAPAITGISPAAGPTTGGTTVTITGTDLTGATAVRFGTRTATILSNTATQIRVTSPNYGSVDTVDITVTTPLGTSATTPADLFTFGRSTVTSVSPNFGPTTGGTTVVITGEGFTGVSAVRFGATAAASYVVNSDTRITAISPVRSAGVIDITVTTPAGTSATSALDRFTYAAPPTVTRVQPAAGTSGTSVVITGTGFSGTGYSATGVSFGGTAATSYSVTSATSITAVAPAGSGTVDIRVTTPFGTTATSFADQFTYGAPVITSISPAFGPTNTNNVVAITGTGFTGVTAVRFGSTAASSYTVNSATSITATSPRSASAGMVHITVITPAGTSATSLADQFTYGAPPRVTARSPTSGPAGTSVTITGTDFTGVTAVKFGSTPASSYTVLSITSIRAVAPAGSGTVDITVTNPFGTSLLSSSDRFRYT